MLDRIADYSGCDYNSRREFILDNLSSMGMTPLRQKISHDGSELLNIGVVYGNSKNLPVSAFSAHYDKTPEGDGILDNGSAVIEMLSTLEKMVKEGSPIPFGFLFFDGEEIGLIGSKGYVNDPFLNLSKVYNLEVTGRGNAIMLGSKSYDLSWKNYIKNSEAMNGRIQKVCTELNVPFFYAGTPPSDNVILNQAGIDSTVFSTVSSDLGELWESEGGPTHKVLEKLEINGVHDTLDKVQPNTLKMVRNILLGIAKQEYQ